MKIRLIVIVLVVGIVGFFYINNWSLKNFKRSIGAVEVEASIHVDDQTINIIDHLINDVDQMISEEDIEYNKVFKFLSYLQPRLSEDVADEITSHVIKQAKLKGFPPELICSLIYIESSCISTAISPTNHGDGLMQVNTNVHILLIDRLGYVREDMFKIGPNIEVGCSILREYYDKTHSIRKALKRYVGGNETKYVIDILAWYVDSQIDIPQKPHKLSQKKLSYVDK